MSDGSTGARPRAVRVGAMRVEGGGAEALGATAAEDLAALSAAEDFAALSAAERARHYVRMCEGVGLDPGARPFAWLRVGGRETLCATRGTTDWLAQIHGLTREIVEGPRVIEVAGTRLVYAVCRARHPDGRVETATATVALRDPLRALVQCETRAKRRATLSILGLAVLDETELDAVPPDARAPGEPTDLAAGQDDVLGRFLGQLREVALPLDAMRLWMRSRREIGASPRADRALAWRSLCGRVREVGRVGDPDAWLRRLIAAEELRREAGGPRAGGLA